MVKPAPAPTLTFARRVVAVLKRVPRGKVVTYGQVAALAGSPRAARQVVRVLYTHGAKENLPWHRVVGGTGTISLRGEGFREQKALLVREGVAVSAAGRIDLATYQWRPRAPRATAKRL